MWSLASLSNSNPFEMSRNGSVEAAYSVIFHKFFPFWPYNQNGYSNASKQSNVKGKSFERNEVSLSTTSGTSSSPFIQNLKSGYKQQSLQSNQVNPTNNVFGNSASNGFGIGNTATGSVLAKRGTVVDDETIKSMATLQNSGLKNSGLGRAENRSSVNADKSNSNSSEVRIQSYKWVKNSNFRIWRSLLPILSRVKRELDRINRQKPTKMLISRIRVCLEIRIIISSRSVMGTELTDIMLQGLWSNSFLVMMSDSQSFIKTL